MRSSNRHWIGLGWSNAIMLKSFLNSLEVRPVIREEVVSLVIPWPSDLAVVEVSFGSWCGYVCQREICKCKCGYTVKTMHGNKERGRSWREVMGSKEGGSETIRVNWEGMCGWSLQEPQKTVFGVNSFRRERRLYIGNVICVFLLVIGFKFLTCYKSSTNFQCK